MCQWTAFKLSSLRRKTRMQFSLWTLTWSNGTNNLAQEHWPRCCLADIIILSSSPIWLILISLGVWSRRKKNSSSSRQCCLTHLFGSKDWRYWILEMTQSIWGQVGLIVGVVLYTEVSFGAQVHMAPRFPRPHGRPPDFPRALLGALEKWEVTLLRWKRI